MTQLEGYARRGFDRILEEHGIQDDALLEKLIAFGWDIRKFQQGEPAGASARWSHPAIQTVKSVTGKRVPDAAIDSVIEMVDTFLRDCNTTLQDQRLKRAYSEWCAAGRDPNSWRWIAWAKNVGRDNRPAAAHQITFVNER